MAHTTNAAKVFELIRTVACMSSRLLSQLCVVVQIIVKLVQTNKTPIKSENTKTHAKVTFPVVVLHIKNKELKHYSTTSLSLFNYRAEMSQSPFHVTIRESRNILALVKIEYWKIVFEKNSMTIWNVDGNVSYFAEIVHSQSIRRTQIQVLKLY